jgi:hypothetical protein
MIVCDSSRESSEACAYPGFHECLHFGKRLAVMQHHFVRNKVRWHYSREFVFLRLQESNGRWIFVGPEQNEWAIIERTRTL